jgi:hypothetical protein
MTPRVGGNVRVPFHSALIVGAFELASGAK